MRTHRVARLVAILLFLAALVYLCGGLAVGLPLWSRGLGAGWGSGFSGWLAIPILVGTLFGTITLVVFGAILYFLARIDTNLTSTRQNQSVSTVEPVATGAVVGGAAGAGAAAPIVPPEAAPVPVEPIVVGAAAAATGAATRDDAPPMVAPQWPTLKRSQRPNRPKRASRDGCCGWCGCSRRRGRSGAQG